MPGIISFDELKLYFQGTKKHKCYEETVCLMNDLKIHADGTIPKKLIEERRPSESVAVMEYRKKIYVPKTKNPISKVINSLSKIRRSPDWSVQYDEKTFPSRIVDEETPENYNEKNFPEHDSVTNWVFSHLLKNYCIDANALVMVVPMNIGAEKANEYYKPRPIIFNSDQVLFYEDGAQYCILKSTEKSDLIKDDNTTAYQQGDVFYVVTVNEYEKWEQTKDGGYQRTEYLRHNKNKLPVFKVRAQFLKQKDNSTIQESRISPMLPSLDEAAREYSDLQASKVQHMFPLFWYYTSKECNACNGTGKITGINGVQQCQQCLDPTTKQGTGKIRFSPYAHLEVEPPKIGEQAAPVPPAGYVARDVEIIKHQDAAVDKHLYNALASINMQFIDQIPLNISGEAKRVDSQELNNFIYSIAEDIICTMDKIYWWNNEWRYSVIVPDKKAREAMLPKTTVPENFDFLPAEYLMDEVKKGKDAKVNPILIASMEQEYASKKFYNNPELATLVNCYYQLDPLPGLSVDEKMSLLTNKGITQEDYVISAYIVSFIKKAIAEDKDFLNKPVAEKMKVIEKYAKEKMNAVSEAEKVKQDLLKEQAASFQDGQNQPIVN